MSRLLDRPSIPSLIPISPPVSSRITTSVSRSDHVDVTCSSRVRADTDQLIRRNRSPVRNGRTPASSVPSPGRRDRCSPTSPAGRGTESIASKPSRNGNVVTASGSADVTWIRYAPSADVAATVGRSNARRPHRFDRSPTSSVTAPSVTGSAIAACGGSYWNHCDRGERPPRSGRCPGQWSRPPPAGTSSAWPSNSTSASQLGVHARAAHAAGSTAPTTATNASGSPNTAASGRRAAPRCTSNTAADADRPDLRMRRPPAQGSLSGSADHGRRCRGPCRARRARRSRRSTSCSHSSGRTVIRCARAATATAFTSSGTT